MKQYTRREALERLSPAVLLSLGLWPGALRAATTNAESFRFIVVNDLHYLTEECSHWLVRMTAQMKSHGNIDLCIVAGDMTDQGKLEHHGAVREILNGLKMPLHVVIGNHDYLAGNSDRAPYEKTYPNSLNYAFAHRGWQFIALDTSEGLKFEKTSIPEHTFTWVDEQIGKFDKDRPTIIFTHFPMGPGVKYRPLNTDSLLERFKPLNLQSIFCGHYHAFTQTQFENAIVTTNRCCSLKRGNHDGTKEKGYFLCSARDGKVTREFVELVPEAKTAATPPQKS